MSQTPPLQSSRTNHRLRYGDKIRLATISAYSTTKEYLAIGFYDKIGRHGVLNCVPPLGKELDEYFIEESYEILHPNDPNAIGKEIKYDQDMMVLVNQHDMVWNTKTGGITGYIGPRARNIPGEVYVSFTKGSEATLEEYICYGDKNISIIVVQSNRSSKMYQRKPLSNYKKPTSHIIGGYICCDGKGTALSFTIWPCIPKIQKITMGNVMIENYEFGKQVVLPLDITNFNTISVLKGNQKMGKTSMKDMQDVVIHLSNGYQARIPSSHLYLHLSNHVTTSSHFTLESTIQVPIDKAPGKFIVTLNGAISAIGHTKHTMRGSSGSNIITKWIPPPLFIIIYGFLVHMVWKYRSTEKSSEVSTSSSSGMMKIFTFRHEFIVLTLVLLPVLYVIGKMDGVKNSTESKQLGSTSTTSKTNKDEILTLVVKEYRFTTEHENEVEVRQRTASDMQELESALNPQVEAIAKFTIEDVPQRFINADKGDHEKALERYKKTQEWRMKYKVNTTLTRQHGNFKLIKDNYPHYYHKRGRNNEPVYYEKPGQINLKALTSAGVTIDDLLENFVAVTEYLWQIVEPDDMARCISVIDVAGIGFSDFRGDAVTYTRRAAAITGSHYPERCAYIIVINAPSWFSVVWKTVRGMLDEVTREKVSIVNSNRESILAALEERIPIENIPVEYGGKSAGESKEEIELRKLMEKLNSEEVEPVLSAKVNEK